MTKRNTKQLFSIASALVLFMLLLIQSIPIASYLSDADASRMESFDLVESEGDKENDKQSKALSHPEWPDSLHYSTSVIGSLDHSLTLENPQSTEPLYAPPEVA